MSESGTSASELSPDIAEKTGGASGLTEASIAAPPTAAVPALVAVPPVAMPPPPIEPVPPIVAADAGTLAPLPFAPRAEGEPPLPLLLLLLPPLPHPRAVHVP